MGVDAPKEAPACKGGRGLKHQVYRMVRTIGSEEAPACKGGRGLKLDVAGPILEPEREAPAFIGGRGLKLLGRNLVSLDVGGG